MRLLNVQLYKKLQPQKALKKYSQLQAGGPGTGSVPATKSILKERSISFYFLLPEVLRQEF